MVIKELGVGDDLLSVSHIYEECWRTAYRGIIPEGWLKNIPEGFWTKELVEAERDSLIVVEDGRPVATVMYGPARFNAAPGKAEIIALYTLPEFQNKGYGSVLMNMALERLKKAGYSQVSLWVADENFKAREFYRRFGFRPNGEVRVTEFDAKGVKTLEYERKL